MRAIAAASIVCVLAPALAFAQTIGRFRWQLHPYCNVVTLTVTLNSGVYTLDGFDDQCGAAQRASVAGTAFLNPDGSVGIGLAIVTAPSGAPLAKIAALPVTTWSFIEAPGIRHAGPMAQDVRAAFGLGENDTSIGYTDINGINMRAIQALIEEIAKLRARVAELETTHFPPLRQ